jgi:hypothetical protein
VTKAIKLKMHAKETLEADHWLKSCLHRLMIQGESEWSGWWIYDAGWSDWRIAAQVSPRLRADHIANFREATGRGRLWYQSTATDER